MRHLTTMNCPYGITVKLFDKGTGFNDYYPFTVERNVEVLFADAIRPSIMQTVGEMDVSLSALAFKTVQPGDVEDGYFAHYTPAQMEWAKSFECEQLSGLVHDAESPESEYHTDALKQFEHVVHP